MRATSRRAPAAERPSGSASRSAPRSTPVRGRSRPPPTPRRTPPARGRTAPRSRGPCRCPVSPGPGSRTRSSWSAVTPDGVRRSPGEAGAHAGHEYPRPLRQAALANALSQAERDRRGGRVAVAVDVHEDLLLGNPELQRSVIDDPLVRLVRHVEVDVVHGEIDLPKELLR